MLPAKNIRHYICIQQSHDRSTLKAQETTFQTSSISQRKQVLTPNVNGLLGEIPRLTLP